MHHITKEMKYRKMFQNAFSHRKASIKANPSLNITFSFFFFSYWIHWVHFVLSDIQAGSIASSTLNRSLLNTRLGYFPPSFDACYVLNAN